MIPAHLKPYPEYKPSGVEWLGDVPAHWEARRLKRWVGINEAILSEATEPDYAFRYLEIGAVRAGALLEEPRRVRFADAPSRARRIVRPGDTIISTVRPYLNAVWYAEDTDGELICSTGFAVLTPRQGTAPKFVSYLAQSRPFSDRMTAESVGTAYPAIAEGKFGSLHVCVPPLAEQDAIVRYLDYMDQRIRRYIEIKEKLLPLLQEARQVTIHQAVARGLDPDVPLKPSGVEWLGDVPAHWEVARLKGHVENVSDLTNECGLDEIYLALENVESWTGRLRDVGQNALFDSQVKRFRVGDVLFSKLRPYLAKVTFPNCKGVCVGEFLVLRCRRDNLMPRYVEHLLRSKPIIDAIDASTFGAKMPRANWQFIGGMKLPLPPLAEQTAIAAHLDKATADIDAAIDATRRQSALMREYRASLIAHVVTGKIDVRATPMADTAALPDAN